MFLVGGTPALLVGFIRLGVKESKRWESRIAEVGQGWTMLKAFGALFSQQYRRRTILNSTYLLISITGLWAGSVYVPTAVSQIAISSGFTESQGVRLGSYGTMILRHRNDPGVPCNSVPGREVWTAAGAGVYFGLMALFIWLSFGYVFLHDY